MATLYNSDMGTIVVAPLKEWEDVILPATRKNKAVIIRHKETGKATILTTPEGLVGLKKHLRIAEPKLLTSSGEKVIIMEEWKKSHGRMEEKP